MSGMIAKITGWIVSLTIIASVGGLLLNVATPNAALAASGDACNQGFLGFPSWYRGLTNSKCDIKSPDGQSGDPTLTVFILTIGINLLEDAVIAVSYISALYMLWGGFVFLTSSGKPENATRARLTMLHSAIGLLISIVAVVAVNYVFTGIIK
jgi:hypothetical protein